LIFLDAEEKYKHLVYIECNKKDIIDDESLENIVGYAISKMNITFKMSDDPKQAYQSYCSALQKKLGGGDPYQVSQEWKELKTESIIDFMFHALPMEQGNITENLKQIITLAAQKATGYVDNKIHEYDSLFHCDSIGCKFAALKVFENGQNLEITPFYITVKGEKIEESNLWNKKVWSKANFDYMQIKFVLTKYSIKAIIKAIQDTHWSLDS
jgi:hypothetical protein